MAEPGEIVNMPVALVRILVVSLPLGPAVAALVEQATVAVKDYIQHRVVEAAEVAPE